MTGQATYAQLVGLSIVVTFVVFSGAQLNRAPRA
jgi:hypothetical protein